LFEFDVVKEGYWSINDRDTTRYYLGILVTLNETEKHRSGSVFLSAGEIDWKDGLYESAEKHLKKALHDFEKEEDLKGQYFSNARLGIVNVESGDFETATASYARALDLAELIGDRKLIARATSDSALGYMLLNNFDKALACHEKALEIYTELQDI